MNTRDVDLFNTAMDWEGFIEQVTSGLAVDPAFREGFVGRFKKSLREPTSFFGDLVRSVEKGGSFRVLRVRDEADGKAVLVRQLHKEGGLNYYSFRVVRRPDGKPRAVDIYVYLSAQMTSDLFRQIYQTGSDGASSSATPEERARTDAMKKSFKLLADIRAAIRAEDPKHAWELYKQLDPLLYAQKSYQIVKINIAQQLNDNDIYLAALDEYRSRFPNDPSLDLILLDAYMVKQDFASAKSAIARFSASIGGDPFLDVLRGECELAEGKPDIAAASAQAALDADETLVAALDLSVRCSIALKKFDETVRLLELGKKRFSRNDNDLEGKPEFADFVKSPQYKTWSQKKP